MPNPKAVKKVTLEGRTRLPQRVQDIVTELGSAMTSVQQTSGSTDLLVTSIRNLTAADGIMANSAQNLEKIEKQMQRLETQTNGTEQGLQNIAIVTTIFDALEQNGYCTNRKSEDEKAEKEGGTSN